MLKKFLIILGSVVAVVIVLGAVKSAQIKKAASAPRLISPSGVATAVAKAERWRGALQAIGTLAPVQGFTLSAEVDGTVVRIAAENGTAVKEGDRLVEFDTSVEVAQRAAASARTELARLSLARQEELRREKAISQSEYDAAAATLKQAQAEVAALDALIARKQIRAPFAGRVGIRLVNLGQYVGRGAPLLPLEKLNPVYANFSIPQRHLPQLAIGQTVLLRVDAFAAERFEATITAINSSVDPVTRNISVQATVANDRELLRAGMFVRVEVQLPEEEPSVVVPATAIAYASYGNSVFVVEKIKSRDGADYLGVRQQFVRLGATRGDLVAIAEGLKPGEEVVTAGVFKLRNGAPVQINNEVQPTANPAPKPANT